MKSYLFFQSEDGKLSSMVKKVLLSAVSECRNMNWESLLGLLAASSL